MKSLILIVAVGSAAAFSSTAGASQASVQMVVTAEMRHGADVPAIAQNEVFVHEGKDRDQVTGWNRAQNDQAALELYVLLDDGANITVGSQLDAVRQFIDAQPATTSVGIAYMQDGEAKVLQNATTDHALADKALRLPMGVIGLDASPYLALTDLLKHWPESAARHEVLMITDGIDHVYGGDSIDNPYVDAAVQKAQQAGVLVYGIYSPGVGHYDHSYFRTSRGQLYLSQLTDQTGGESFDIGFSGPPVSFTPYLNELNQRLGRQFFLDFIPKPQKKSGMQRIKLSTEIPNVELVGQENVYVRGSE